MAAWERAGGVGRGASSQTSRADPKCRSGAPAVPAEYHQAGVKMGCASGRSLYTFYDLIAGSWEM